MHVVHGLLYFVTMFLVCMNFKTNKKYLRNVLRGFDLHGRRHLEQSCVSWPRVVPKKYWKVSDRPVVDQIPLHVSLATSWDLFDLWHGEYLLWRNRFQDPGMVHTCRLLDRNRYGPGKKFKNVTNYTFPFPELKKQNFVKSNIKIRSDHGWKNLLLNWHSLC